jgi:serine protease AprX
MIKARSLLRSLTGVFAGAALLAGSVTAATPSLAAQSLVPLSPSLVQQLATATGAPMPIMVHGSTLAAANAAVASTGMVKMASFDKVAIVAALATPTQVAAARTQPGVIYLEGNQPLRYFTSTSHHATGSDAAWASGYTGAGVSVAIVDSGIDPTHPSFAGGKVVRNMKSLCVDETTLATNCILDLPNTVNTDLLAVGGHGTHVSGIAAGNPVTLTNGKHVSGAAPGAKIVSISTGAVLLIIGADAALNWVLNNHANPCAGCPPIKVINNSYGPSGGGEFDPMSATARIQEALAEEGVVTVWANGNDGGDGSANLSNPPGQDPKPGIISVASYYDLDTGVRTGHVSDFSSRGAAQRPSTWPDISAPGENITSSCRPYLPICSTGLDFQNGPGLLDIGTFNTISGTSMATPHIVGIVAQLFQAVPTASPGAVEAAIKATAFKYGPAYDPVTGSSFDRGHGLVDVPAAIAYLQAHPQ